MEYDRSRQLRLETRWRLVSRLQIAAGKTKPAAAHGDLFFGDVWAVRLGLLVELCADYAYSAGAQHQQQEEGVLLLHTIGIGPTKPLLDLPSCLVGPGGHGAQFGDCGGEAIDVTEHPRARDEHVGPGGGRPFNG